MTNGVPYYEVDFVCGFIWFLDNPDYYTHTILINQTRRLYRFVATIVHFT